MRPIKKSNRLNPDGTSKTYKPFDLAKSVLIDEIGQYCCFCDIRSSYSGLAVEHVQPKNYLENGSFIYKHLEYSWSNFLLACTNCNSVKGVQKVELNEFVLPHLDNTYDIFRYGSGGEITIDKKITDEHTLERAQRTIQLIGLDRRPGHPKYSRKDLRWKERFEAWTLAKSYLVKYQASEIKLADLLQIAKLTGFWRIWVSIFEDADEHEVVKELFVVFKGTRHEVIAPKNLGLI